MYEKFLTAKSVFFHKQTLILFLAYFGIRFLSFFLNKNYLIQSILVFAVLMIFGSLYYKKQDWAWYILLGELMLGGAGHFFEFLDLSIRTALFSTFIILWFIQTILNKKTEMFNFPKKIYFLVGIFGFFLFLSAIIGISNHNSIKSVIQDLIPYSFFVLIFPIYHLFEKKENQEYLIRLLSVFLIGSVIFSLFTFILFSSGIAYLQSPYYKWFRDVAMGKITDMGENFFRIVTPEHLLIVPIALILASLLMKKEKHHTMWWLSLIAALLILILDFSRIYLLALGVGLLILKYRHNWKNWLFVNLFIFSTIVVLFSSTNIIASGGKSIGLDLFLGRVRSIAQPETETSSLTRITLLPPIIDMINLHPIIGSGIGSKVTFNDPISGKLIQTSQFDWGYFELFAELGLFGFISFLSIIFYIIKMLIKKIKFAPDFYDLYVGLLTGTIALLIMNITSPILFHSLGILYLVFIIVLIAKTNSILDIIVTLLYRTFRRLRN